MDKGRFRELYDLYSGKLYNYVLWMTRSREAAEDIIQNVFVKVWQYPAVPRSQQEIEPWLYAVARNKCLDFFRKCSRFSRFRLKFAHETPLHADASQEKRLTWEILGTLGEEERSVLYLHLRAGYSYKEIATMLESTENATRVKAFRALAKLRKRYIKEHNQ